MKRFGFFVIILLFIGGLFSVNAQDIIVLRDGNIIEAKIIEISDIEIRYKKFGHLDGPNIVLSLDKILSIKYENGTIETLNTSSTNSLKNIVINENKSFSKYYISEMFRWDYLIGGIALKYKDQHSNITIGVNDTIKDALLLYPNSAQSYNFYNSIVQENISGGIFAQLKRLKFGYEYLFNSVNMFNVNKACDFNNIEETGLTAGQFYNLEMFHWNFDFKKGLLLNYKNQYSKNSLTGININSNIMKNAFFEYPDSRQAYDSYRKKTNQMNILYYGGLGLIVTSLAPVIIWTATQENNLTSTLIASGGLLLGGFIVSMIGASKVGSGYGDLFEAVNKYNINKANEFQNNTFSSTSIKNSETDNSVASYIDNNKLTFGLSINPAGFIPNAGGGPSITMDFTKGKFNSTIDIRSGFGFVRSFYGYELFGIGSIFNYYHPSKIGGFYIGGLIEYTLGKNISDEILHRFGLAGNIGYKFITKSGMYFRTGFKGGYSFGEGNGLIVRPDLSFGYIF